MSRKLTNDEFIKRMKVINPNIKFLNEYINQQVKIQCECLSCNHKWSAKPNNLLNGTGCPICARKRIYVNKTKSHKQFIFEIELINNNIEIIDKYINNHTNLRCKCKKCNHEWYATPSNLLKGKGCPKCAGKYRTTEDFCEKINKINPNIKILSEYVDVKTKVKCRCLIDNYEWYATPNHLLRGRGCPKCAKKSVPTQEEFIEKLNTINPKIEVLNNYINAKTKVECLCLECKHKWMATPSNLLSGYGCPICNCSKGEIAIIKTLDKNKVNYISQYTFSDCKYKQLLPFDFYLPDYNLCIEYDGELHYMAVNHFGGEEHLKTQQMRDNIKTKYCQENNIKLLRIPYWEFNNIDNILNDNLIRYN